MQTFLEDGQVEIDNNENAIRSNAGECMRDAHEANRNRVGKSRWESMTRADRFTRNSAPCILLGNHALAPEFICDP